jgi:hypothetical protein
MPTSAIPAEHRIAPAAAMLSDPVGGRLENEQQQIGR